MMDIVLRVFAGLLPDRSSAPEAQYRYQLRLGITVSVMLAWVAYATVFATGWVPAVNTGFARSADLSTVITELKQNRAQNVDNQLLELRIKHCKATTDESKQLYWSKIEPLLIEYQQLTGHQYVLPQCNDV